MKKLLLTCAAALMAVGSAWADWTDVYTQDCENVETIDAGWSTSVSGRYTSAQNVRSGSTHYFQYNAGSTNGATLTFTGISNCGTDYTSSDNYKIEFDFSVIVPNASSSSGGQTVNYTIKSTTGSELISFQATQPAKTNQNQVGKIYLNGIEQTETFKANTAAYWYHACIIVENAGVAMTITDLSDDTQLAKYELSNSLVHVGNFSYVTGKTYGGLCLDDITVSKYVEAGVVEKPTAAISRVNNGIRRIQFSCLTEDVAFSYSTDHGANYTDCATGYVDIDTNTSIIVKATKDGNSSVSEEYNFEAGTNVVLATPTFRVTTLTEDASGAYYPTIDATCNNSAVLLNPAANVTATFNGDPVSLPYVATQDGSLVVTATCDGYTSSENTYNVTSLVKAVLADYTNVSSIGAPAAGMRKWSGNDHWALEEGVGIKAVRDGGNSWFQIDRAGMVAYDEVSEDQSTTTTYIDVANSNTGNNSLKYVTPGKYVAKLYYFTEGKAAKIAASGYTTVTAPFNFTVAGGTPYYAASTAAESVTLTSVDAAETVFVAGAGLMIKGTAGATVTLTATSADATFNETNLLVGVTAADHVMTDGANYVLATKNATGETAFYRYTGEAAPLVGKAYLNVAGGSASALRIDIEGMEDGYQTAISLTPSLSEGEGACYDLYGRKSNGKGLMIQNGKVVLVK